MWGTSLSGPLGIVGLVGRYPANCLMPRMPIRHPLAGLSSSPCGMLEPWGITPAFAGLFPCAGQVAYALRTRPPVAGTVLLQPAAPRLACVKPAASVHPEPGSNSSLLLNLFVISLVVKYHRSVLPYSWLKLSFQCTLFTPLAFHPSLPFWGVQMYTLFLFRKLFFVFFYKILTSD